MCIFIFIDDLRRIYIENIYTIVERNSGKSETLFIIRERVG